MSTISILNISIGLVGLTLCGIVILHILAGSRKAPEGGRKFLLMFMCLELHIACNMAGQLMRGIPGYGIRIALKTVNFGEFSSSTLLAFLVVSSLIHRLNTSGSLNRLQFLAGIFLGIHILLLIVNLFTGLCYIIDINNIYQRCPGYPLTYLMPLAIMLVAFFLLIRDGNRLTKKERIAYWLYFLIPFFAMCIQVQVYGIYVVVFALVLAAVIMYIFLVSDQQEQYYLQKQTNDAMKVEIMLSQIQPHFLYNSLAVIREICLIDGRRGADAIEEFTEYLRHNMDSIQISKPLPFEKELNHTRRYLHLQQMRFGGELNISYDIGCTDFCIPSLTLQPLVENAVRYGVRKKEEGDGHVMISTREHEEYYEIRITDDGPGFDAALITDDDRQHVGLRNVRHRLEYTVGGQLKIDSVIGKGTIVTMFLPKE